MRFLLNVLSGLFGRSPAANQHNAKATPVVTTAPPKATLHARNMTTARAVAALKRHAPELRRNPYPPYTDEVKTAFGALRQPLKSYIQARIGLGEQLRVLQEGKDETDWVLAQHKLAESDAGINEVVKAIFCEVYLDVPEEAAVSLVHQWKQDFWRRRPRLDFIDGPLAAREAHVVEAASGVLIFPRVVELGPGGRIEIQRNLCGLHIQRDPVGMLNRATMEKAGWKPRPGWWIVQAEGMPPGEDGGEAPPPAYDQGL